MEEETMRQLLVALLLVGGVSTSSNAQALSPQLQPFVSVSEPVVVLTHTRVIDGTGTAASANQWLVIEHGIIKAVGDSSRVVIPNGARIIDLAGKSVMPGFVMV